MITILSIIFIFIISVILAIIESKKELAIPEEVENLKIKRRNSLSGVILFLKDKIVHYSTHSSS